MTRATADVIFRRVKCRIWRSGSFTRLSPVQPSGQALWLYLLTCPESCTIPGAIVAGRAQLAEALRWPVENFASCWSEIEAEGMAIADWNARLIWLPRGPYENPPNNPNVAKAWTGVFRTLPDCDLKTRIFHDLDDFMKGYGQAFAEAFTEAFGKAPTKALPKARGKESDRRDEGLGIRDEGSKEQPPSTASQSFPPCEGGTAAATKREPRKRSRTTEPDEPELPPEDPPETPAVDQQVDGDLPENPNPESVDHPDDDAYPWHPEDEEQFAKPDGAHPRWDDYVETHMALKTPAPWPRFLPWLSAEIKKRVTERKHQPDGSGGDLRPMEPDSPGDGEVPHAAAR